MSRFANPEAKARLVLGPCQCTEAVHSEDWMELRTELGVEDALRLAQGSSLDVLEILVVGWNLLDDDGELAPVDREHLARLFADSFDTLNGWIEEHVRLRALPNDSAARSPRSSVASGSRPLRTVTKAG